jgi:hypothetical protein
VALIEARRQVTSQPWIVHSVDPSVAAYVASIGLPTIHSDTAAVEWGFAIDGTLDGGATGGTAYLLSAAAMQRVQTGRI